MSDIEQEVPPVEEAGPTEGEQPTAETAEAPTEVPPAEEAGPTEGEQPTAETAEAPTEAPPAEEAGEEAETSESEA